MIFQNSLSIFIYHQDKPLINTKDWILFLNLINNT